MFHDITLNRLGCRPFPFKGKARMGMGTLVATCPIPTPTLPLKGRELPSFFLNRADEYLTIPSSILAIFLARCA
jgi:hypothetical protein